MRSVRSDPKTYRAPAKVNLRLEVVRKREDGYHEIRSIMCPVSLYDEVILTPTTHPGIKVTADTPELPSDKNNLAHKAASLLLEESCTSGGMHIHLQKRIPISAGLGGGSSDAAAVMRGVNELYRLNYTQSQLLDLGATIGSDVPFFFLSSPAFATGRGEKLSPLRVSPPFWILLVTPPIAVSTAWAYGEYKVREQSECVQFSQTIDLLAEGRQMLRNDLEDVVASRFPEIQEVKGAIAKLGAWSSLMSGSGPTVFGIFFEERDAKSAEAGLVKGYGHRHWAVALAKGLT